MAKTKPASTPRKKKKGLNAGKLLTASVAAVATWLLLAWALDWRITPDSKMPLVAFGMSLIVAGMVLFGIETHGLILAGLLGLVPFFIVHANPGAESTVTSGYVATAKQLGSTPTCKAGRHLNDVGNACVRSKRARR